MDHYSQRTYAEMSRKDLYVWWTGIAWFKRGLQGRTAKQQNANFQAQGFLSQTVNNTGKWTSFFLQTETYRQVGQRVDIQMSRQMIDIQLG